MTEMELFPRGKTAADTASGGKGATKGKGDGKESNGQQAGKPGRKRKAPGVASLGNTAGERDWLFGSPQPKTLSSGKKSRGDGDGGVASGSRNDKVC